MALARVAVLGLLILHPAGLVPAQVAPREVSLTSADGTPLQATYHPAATPGPAVLLLHMCSTTRAAWSPLAPHLAAAGIHALSVDYRGFGESGGERFDALAPDAAQRIVSETWPADIDGAFEFLVAQPGVDRTRIGAAGAGCGVAQAVKLARRHPGVRSLALLAGLPDVEGIAFIADAPWLPIFAGAAGDDQSDRNAPEMMRWLLALSGNPRNKFSGFRDGGHGTDMFGRHPALVKALVEWFTDTLITRPADPEAAVPQKSTPAREFWRKAVSPSGVAEAIQMFYDLGQRGQRVQLFTEGQLNELGYFHLQAGRAGDASRLFRLNTLVYPSSANTYDSLADAYLATGQHELALRMSERALELLPKDRSSDALKEAIRKSAEARIAKLKEAMKN